MIFRGYCMCESFLEQIAHSPPKIYSEKDICFLGSCASLWALALIPGTPVTALSLPPCANFRTCQIIRSEACHHKVVCLIDMVDIFSIQRAPSRECIWARDVLRPIETIGLRARDTVLFGSGGDKLSRMCSSVPSRHNGSNVLSQ